MNNETTNVCITSEWLESHNERFAIAINQKENTARVFSGGTSEQLTLNLSEVAELRDFLEQVLWKSQILDNIPGGGAQS